MRPKKVILLAIGNPYELSLMSFRLSTLGFRVIAAETAKTAMMGLNRSLVDLALIDSKLPDMSGCELVMRCKNACPLVPVVLLCDSPDTEIHVADAMLGRKTKTADLVERIKVLTAKKRWLKKSKLDVLMNSPAAEVA